MDTLPPSLAANMAVDMADMASNAKITKKLKAAALLVNNYVRVIEFY